MTTNNDVVVRYCNDVSRYIHDLFMTRNESGPGYESCFLSKKKTTKLCNNFFSVVVQYSNMNLLVCEHGNRTELQYTFRSMLEDALHEVVGIIDADFIESVALKLADTAIKLAKAICSIFGEMLLFDSRTYSGVSLQFTYYKSVRYPKLGKWVTFYLEWDDDLDEANAHLLRGVEDTFALGIVFPEGTYNPFLGETVAWN